MAQPARRVAHFSESVIREMTRLSNEHGALNLAQGFPDYDPPSEVLEWAREAIAAGENQYAVTWGDPRLRKAVASKVSRHWGVPVDPDEHVTVTCGATEGVAAALLAILNPGDEVVLFEPFYENYLPVSHLAGAVARYVRLEPPHYRIEEAALNEAVTDRTKAIVLNTPNNPTGRVYGPDELEMVRRLCIERDLILVTDEIYEHYIYDDRIHVPPATLPDMRERTISVSGLSKTLSITGWRIGYVIAPWDFTLAVRKVHDFLTVGAPAPLQVGAARALDFLPDTYYTSLAASFQGKRDRFTAALRRAGFHCEIPEGAYYVLARTDRFLDAPDDSAAARMLIQRHGIAAVPGSSFYRTDGERPSVGNTLRFAFCKRDETLAQAEERLLNPARTAPPRKGAAAG